MAQMPSRWLQRSPSPQTGTQTHALRAVPNFIKFKDHDLDRCAVRVQTKGYEQKEVSPVAGSTSRSNPCMVGDTVPGRARLGEKGALLAIASPAPLHPPLQSTGVTRDQGHTPPQGPMVGLGLGA